MCFGMEYGFTGKMKTLSSQSSTGSPHRRLNGRRRPAHRPGTDPSMRAQVNSPRAYQRR